MGDKKWYTTKEVADEIGGSTATVRDMIRTGEIKGAKPLREGKRRPTFRIPEEELERLRRRPSVEVAEELETR